MDKENPLAQALSLLETILSEMDGLSKPHLSFMRWIFGVWLGLPVRHNILNLARFGSYCEKSVRLHMARGFDFAGFGRLLIEKRCDAERLCAFDPTYIGKSGKQTYGLDYWWCGTLQKSLRGLELGVLGVIDVQARSAFSLQATQTPCLSRLRAQGHNLMSHYLSLLQGQARRLQQLGVRYVAADAYFANQSFLEGVKGLNFDLITRLRSDANLRYLYHGPRNPTGRPKKYDGKVDCRKIDKRRLRLFRQEAGCSYYSGVVWAVSLKRLVRIVYIQRDKGKGKARLHCILMSSDVELVPEKIVEYYKLRFQIEFLIRDARSYAGLEECQARDQDKLFFHFNLALAAVSWVKAALWLPVPPSQRGPFSLRNISLLFTAQMWTEKVLQNLRQQPSLLKHQHAYQCCWDIKQLAI